MLEVTFQPTSAQPHVASCRLHLYLSKSRGRLKGFLVARANETIFRPFTPLFFGQQFSESSVSLWRDDVSGPSEICLGYVRFAAATHEMPVATPPMEPSKGRVRSIAGLESLAPSLRIRPTNPSRQLRSAEPIQTTELPDGPYFRLIWILLGLRSLHHRDSGNAGCYSTHCPFQGEGR